MKLSKVHNVVSFKQSDFMRKYIDKNTQMRTKATNDFEKDYYKLMNNSVFGKTMENVRNHSDNYEFIINPERYKKVVSNPRFKGSIILKTQTDSDDGLVMVERSRTKISLNKPIAIGISILDISKIRMYDFYYNQIKKRYKNKVELCYTDTDSFVMLIIR